MGGIGYNAHLVIDGPATGGSQDPDGGYNPGDTGPPKYDGPADAQDSDSGFQVTTPNGLKVVNADVQVYLQDESKITDMEVGDQGTLTRKGVDAPITTKAIRYIDGRIFVNL